MGTRGIPAHYGGFETFYENLGTRLAARGYDVTVYNRPRHVGPHAGRIFHGVHLVDLPSINTKHLDTITHTALSVIHGLTRRYDLVYVCGVGNMPLAWVPRVVGAHVIFNVDSADWRRAKWGPFAAWYLRMTERYAAKAANLVVADSEAIQVRYEAAHGIAAVFVPYGANVGRTLTTAALNTFGLEARGYILWVGRLEPESRVDELIEAFRSLDDPGLRLVIVGDAPFADDYKAGLRERADARVVFTGYAFGEAYRELGSHALAYVQTSPTSGTSPALLDQMAAGNAVVVRDTATNRETIGEAGVTYDGTGGAPALAAALRSLLDDPSRIETLRDAAVARVIAGYSWDAIVDRYERLFAQLLDARTGTRAAPADGTGPQQR